MAERACGVACAALNKLAVRQLRAAQLALAPKPQRRRSSSRRSLAGGGGPTPRYEYVTSAAPDGERRAACGSRARRRRRGARRACTPGRTTARTMVGEVDERCTTGRARTAAVAVGVPRDVRLRRRRQPVVPAAPPRNHGGLVVGRRLLVEVALHVAEAPRAIHHRLCASVRRASSRRGHRRSARAAHGRRIGVIDKHAAPAANLRVETQRCHGRRCARLEAVGY